MSTQFYTETEPVRYTTPEQAAHPLFPRSEVYRRLLSGQAQAVHEPAFDGSRFLYSERHLQCVWYDEEWRPQTLISEQGEEIYVEDPGVWNMEDGPDFKGAVLQIGPERRRLCGDIEVHVHPRHWSEHGHGDDPRYDHVVAHVTWFSAPLESWVLPPGAEQLSLKKALSANPFFSFENLDTSAYPYAVRNPETRCHEMLHDWTRDDKQALLDAAGEERLRRKTEYMEWLIQDRGADQAIYEETFRALGYKHNKAPFRYLSDKVPLQSLLMESENDPVQAYALLMGISGLLPKKHNRQWDRETRSFVRKLWDTWWKKRAHWESVHMDGARWKLSSLRPVNHPVRRLMAACTMFVERPSLSRDWLHLAGTYPGSIIPRLMGELQLLSKGYWDYRLSWAGAKQSWPIALIGRSRATAMIINIVTPFLAAMNCAAPFRQQLLDQLPREADNDVIRKTAGALFGRDHSPVLYKNGLRRQGLIQIFHDFCLNDRSLCRTCSLPELLGKYKSGQRS